MEQTGYYIKCILMEAPASVRSKGFLGVGEKRKQDPR